MLYSLDKKKKGKDQVQKKVSEIKNTGIKE
jgi:hypothetical protein